MTSVPSVVGLAAIKRRLIMKLDNYKLCSFAKTALVMHIYYSYITNLTKKSFPAVGLLRWMFSACGAGGVQYD